MFSEILLCNQLRSRSNVRQIYSSSGELDHYSVSLLKNSLKHYFNNQDVERFLNEIAKLPPERTTLYFVPIYHGEEDVLSRILLIGHKLLTLEDKLQVVLSPWMLNALYTAKFGKMQVCLANPVLGNSVSAKNFMNPMQRDLLVPCSLFPESTPVIADNYIAKPAQFYHHDGAYHVFIESAIPYLHRIAWIELAAIYSPKDPIYRRILDREFKTYFNTSSSTNAFLQELANTVANSEENPAKPISYLYRNRHRWVEEYGIDILEMNQIHCKGANLEKMTEALFRERFREAISKLSPHKLHRLDLSQYHERLTDDDLASLSKLMIESLNLSDTYWITGEGFKHLSNMPLRHLNLTRCLSLNSSYFVHLLNMPLETLNLTGLTRQLEVEDILRFAKSLWKAQKPLNCKIIMPAGSTIYTRSQQSCLDDSWKWLNVKTQHRAVMAVALGILSTATYFAASLRTNDRFG